MNVVSRDWAVEIATDDELTILNSWLRAIDQGRESKHLDSHLDSSGQYLK